MAMIRRLFGRSSLTGGSNWINSRAEERRGRRGPWCKGAGKVVIDKEGREGKDQ